MRYTITARCARNHIQSVTVEQFNDHDAMALAKVLDGTSDLFVQTPDVGSGPVLGRCGTCGASFFCTVKPA